VVFPFAADSSGYFGSDIPGAWDRCGC